jgi:hypothetical protein
VQHLAGDVRGGRREQEEDRADLTAKKGKLEPQHRANIVTQQMISNRSKTRAAA